MKSDPEELPKIRFESREARRHRHRHKHRKHSSENKHSADIDGSSAEKPAGQTDHDETSLSEPPRIPPLPDLGLFISGTQGNGSQSSERRPNSQTKNPRSIKKKRQSIEMIKSKEREILGDLFAVEKTTKVVKRKLQLKDIHGKTVRNESTEPVKITLGRDITDKDSLNKNTGRKGLSGKTDDGKQLHSRCRNLSGKSNDEREQSTRSRHSSDKSADGKTDTKAEDGCKKSDRNTDGDPNLCQFVKKLSSSLFEKALTRNPDKNLVSELKSVPHVPVHIDDRNDTDKSDMCHQVSCSRTGPFDLLASLDKSYRMELENLKISPRSKNILKKRIIPVVDLHSSRSLHLSQKSVSVESSESESDSEKGKRHFMDVFSDISEAESEISIKESDILNKDVDDLRNKSLKKKEIFDIDITDTDKNELTFTVCHNTEVKENEEDAEKEAVVIVDDVFDKREVSPVKMCQDLKHLQGSEMLNTINVDGFKDRKNYLVKVDEFSDISDDEENQVTIENIEDGCMVSDDVSIDSFVNTPIGGNDYLRNSSLTEADTDKSVHIEKTESKMKTETEMPVLEKALHNKSKCSDLLFEMPILEKYTEMYSSFRSGLDEQEVLPDIEDEEVEMDDIEVLTPVIAHTHHNKPSSHFTEVPGSNSNIFRKFYLSPERTGVKSASETVSLFKPSTSDMPASFFSGMKPCKSDNFLSSPKDCSTPKSRKRKIRKSTTCTSLCGFETHSSFTPTATSSHLEKLSLTKQMDQLTDSLKDFLCLNDSKVLLPKLPEAQKNIVYGCEEEGLLNLGHALNFIEHFCQKYVIPSDLCRDVIKSAFHSECKLSHIHWAYNLLTELNMRRSAEIDICWETVEGCLNIALSASKDLPYSKLLQSTFLLQLAVDVLKMDLYSRDLSDSRDIRKSFAFKMFAYDVSTGSRKRLIYFLNQALHAGQCRTGTGGETFRLPDVLPMLQDLFALCVDVSSSCVDCANTLAADMVNTYKFLPNLADKQLMIKSVSSQLLQCKLIQYVLESQYDCHQTLGGAFPEALEDIIQCFFKVMPLKNPLTPPTTPNEDMIRDHDELFNMYSPEVTEEIAILLYFVVVSYLQASNDKLYMALRLRINLPKRKKRLRTEDVEELAKMHEHVQDLEHHLRCMTPDLTENTEHYLFLMRCLGDLGQVQQE